MTSPTASTWSLDFQGQTPKHRASWIPGVPQTHNLVQVVRKHHAYKTKRPSLYSSNTWPRSPTTNAHNRPELTSSNSNSSPLSQGIDNPITTTTTTFQQHRRTITLDAEPPSVPSRNPKRISDIQGSKISSAFTTTICCHCFRYMTLHRYYYECTDKGCKGVACNECIEVYSYKQGVNSFNILEGISKGMEYREEWKKMNFLEQFETTGKALDRVCRLYPVKIVQKRCNNYIYLN